MVFGFQTRIQAVVKCGVNVWCGPIEEITA
jgi:hypothetical protein